MIEKTNDEQTALLRDALDHIARIATAARQPTRRLDWIPYQLAHNSFVASFIDDSLKRHYIDRLNAMFEMFH